MYKILSEMISMKLFSRNMVWKRGQNNFAYCISDLNLANLITKKVVIEQGSKVFILQNGVYSGIYPSGIYTFGDIILHLGLNLRKQTTVIIVDAGEVNVPFRVTDQDNVRTEDNFTVSANGNLLVRINDSSLFYEHYLKMRDGVSFSDIVDEIHHNIVSGMKSVLSQHGVAALYGSSELHAFIIPNLINEVNYVLNRKGFEICSIVSVEFSEDAWKPVVEKQNRSKTDVELARTEATTNILLREFAAADTLSRIDTMDTIDRAERKAKADKESDALHHEISLDNVLFEHRMKKLKAIIELREQKQRTDFRRGKTPLCHINCCECGKNNVESAITCTQCKLRI